MEGRLRVTRGRVLGGWELFQSIASEFVVPFEVIQIEPFEESR